MAKLEDLLVKGATEAPRPLYSGAVGLIHFQGRVEQFATAGQTAIYADTSGTPTSSELSRRVTGNTIFDLASITMVYVTTAVLSLVEEGVLGLDEPVATWLPSSAGGERARVTLRRLLTRTSGLPALLSLWIDWPDRRSRIDAILNARAHDQVPDVGVLEAGARGAYQRGGGAAGHAGIFGTAGELARLGEILRCYGALDGVRVLSEETVEQMTRDQLPAGVDPGFRHGLGPRIDDPRFMGALAGAGAFGHTGFTATSLVVDRGRELVTVLLTNRVQHPSRDWADVSGRRREVAALAAQAHPGGQG